MSFLTATQMEAISAQAGAGSAVIGTTTTAQVISKNPGGAAYLPANLFSPATGVGRLLKFQARGIVTTVSANAQTLQIGVGPDTSQGTATALASCLAPTAAFTLPASLTNVFWIYEGEIVCTATGGSGTWLALGSLRVIATSGGTAAGALIEYSAGSTTAVSLSTESAYYLELCAQWGASNTSATNSITCETFDVFGCN